VSQLDTSQLEQFPVVWLTRDLVFGVLDTEVDVWCERPAPRHLDDGDVLWGMPPEGERVVFAADGVADDEPACLGSLSLEDALRFAGPGVPATSRECLRVGPAPARTAA
jgi:hypothetical protein